VISVSSPLRERGQHREAQAPGRAPTGVEAIRAAGDRQAARVRRLRINVAAWAVATVLLTTLWVVNQWQANGALESFGHEGEEGQWNPTLWALGIGIWGLIVGIMALGVHFGRSATEAEIDREAARLTPGASIPTEAEAAFAEARWMARRRLDGVRRVRFHVAAWVLGMTIATPLWALIEWQDNGGFERFGADDQPGSWEPWILYVGGIWAGVIALLALRVFAGGRRPGTTARSA
jgi:hypothetical protein